MSNFNFFFLSIGLLKLLFDNRMFSPVLDEFGYLFPSLLDTHLKDSDHDFNELGPILF